MHAGVRAEHAAVAVDHGARPRGVRRLALDERRRSRRPARSKSPGCRASASTCSFSRSRVRAHGVLVEMPDRETPRAQLLLRQRKQEVGLILRIVGAAMQPIPPVVVALDARVVAGRQLLGVVRLRAIQQLGELQIAVAVRAGNRRAAGARTRARSSRSRARRTATRN